MATQEAQNAPSWQKSVPQSFRSEKISEIATELAKLEDNATQQGKLALASKFENKLFTAATSVNDYHKRIAKRLKKLKKNYAKNPPPPAPSGAAASNETNEANLQEEINSKKRKLRLLYGEPMRLIAENGRTAAAGYPKLIDHIDKMNEWATEIGAIPTGTLKISTNEPLTKIERPPRDTLDHLNGLEKMLQTKIETLREWILKFSQEERFFGEKLEQMERNILTNTENDNCAIFYKALREVIEEVGADDLYKMSNADIGNSLKSYQNRLRQTVPIPRSKEDEKRASLVYLDKIRAASQICLLYALIPPEDHSTKLEFAGSLRSANTSIFEAIEDLKNTYKETVEGGDAASQGKKIKLEDAWNKVLEYDKPEEENITSGVIDNDTEGGQTRKRGRPLALRARMLLSVGRKLPSNLLDALKRKQAVLCQDSGTYSAPYLKLQFGDAFEMLIYFSPLLVRIKAVAKGEDSKQLSIVQREEYSILGVKGDIESVGPLIVKRLEFASAQATRCLRRCFADLACRTSSSDFETEISEGNALLRFLNLARNTHCPDWTDAC